jgi:hypothetical protein
VIFARAGAAYDSVNIGTATGLKDIRKGRNEKEIHYSLLLLIHDCDDYETNVVSLALGTEPLSCMIGEWAACTFVYF